MQPRFLQGFEATVDRVIYSPELPTPPDQRHPFVYYITIRNGSDRTVTVKGRKWVVRGESGHVTAVEGDGVVGCFPRPSPEITFPTIVITPPPEGLLRRGLILR